MAAIFSKRLRELSGVFDDIIYSVSDWVWNGYICNQISNTVHGSTVKEFQYIDFLEYSDRLLFGGVFLPGHPTSKNERIMNIMSVLNFILISYF